MIKRVFTFYKNDSGEWYINLPEWKGDPEDLQMVEGADKWLDLISNHDKKVKLTLADSSFKDAEVLTLLHIREENLGGGGDYFLENYDSKKVNLKLWLCEVTSFVFEGIPQKIYFKVC